jgi:hypothetical protein
MDGKNVCDESKRLVVVLWPMEVRLNRKMSFDSLSSDERKTEGVL